MSINTFVLTLGKLLIGGLVFVGGFILGGLLETAIGIPINGRPYFDCMEMQGSSVQTLTSMVTCDRSGKSDNRLR